MSKSKASQYDDDDYVEIEAKSEEKQRQQYYAWEEEYRRSWDVLQEDSDGSLVGLVASLVGAGKRSRHLRDTTPYKRGIIRNIAIIIDMGSAMLENDLRPSRWELTRVYLIEILSEFFEQNPIAQVALFGMKDGLAFQITELSGNVHEHKRALEDLKDTSCYGQISLQNGLRLARSALKSVPSYGTKEVLIIHGSINTNDPGDVYATIQQLQNDKIRVQIVGLASQVAVCSKIVSSTNEGDDSGYRIVMNEQHYKEILLTLAVPPALANDQQFSALIMMGFASRYASSDTSYMLCACHNEWVRTGYQCPRCKVVVCSLPSDCPVCHLTLVLSTHLARSYHHLFPLQNWKEIIKSSDIKIPNSICFGCRAPLISTLNLKEDKDISNKMEIDEDANSKKFNCGYICPTCHCHFCLDCDIFVHEQLFECPGCQNVNRLDTNITG